MYPALGVEAIRQVPSSSRGAGLGAYAVFFDMALAIAGPVMGAVAVHLCYASIFCVAALLALAGVGLTLLLPRHARRSGPLGRLRRAQRLAEERRRFTL